MQITISESGVKIQRENGAYITSGSVEAILLYEILATLKATKQGMKPTPEAASASDSVEDDQ